MNIEVNIEEIKANAPENATHYKESKILSFAYYFKVDGDDVWIWTIFNRFEKTLRKFSEYDQIHPL